MKLVANDIYLFIQITLYCVSFYLLLFLLYVWVKYIYYIVPTKIYKLPNFLQIMYPGYHLFSFFYPPLPNSLSILKRFMDSFEKINVKVALLKTFKYTEGEPKNIFWKISVFF